MGFVLMLYLLLTRYGLVTKLEQPGAVGAQPYAETAGRRGKPL
jgi:hypothetical protein